MSSTVVVAAVFLKEDPNTKEKQILLFRRAPGESWAGFYEFPGGKLEVGETEPEALRRELKEELGIEAQVGDFFGNSLWNNGQKWIDLRCYLVAPPSGKLDLKNHDLHSWFTENSIPWAETAPADHEIIRKVFSSAD